MNKIIFKKSILLGAILATSSITIALPRIAWADDAARITRLEERLGELEARMAKSEATMHKPMGMMKHGKSGPGMGMGSPMTPAPQAAPSPAAPANSEMGGTMPPAGTPPAAGMGGHM